MYITINGADPVDPDQLKDEFERLEYDASKWYGKANSFTYRRGTSPSVGYFLMKYGDLPSSESSAATLVVNTKYNPDNPSLESGSTNKVIIEGLEVAETVAVKPSFLPEDTVYLVKIIDPIVNKWNYTYVEKDYNIRLGLNPIDDSVIYDPTTINGSLPYTWKEVFEDIAGVSLDDTEANFYENGPEAIQFSSLRPEEPYSAKEALDCLLTQTGHTIIRKPNGSMSIAAIDTSEVGDAIAYYKEDKLKFDTHVTKHKQSAYLPQSIEWRFPKEKLDSTPGSGFSIRGTSTAASFSPKMILGFTWKVKSFLYSGANDQQYADHYQTVFNKAWEGIYSGLFKFSCHTYLNVLPSKAISMVTWSYLGDGTPPSTHVNTEPTEHKDFPQSPTHVRSNTFVKAKAVGVSTENNYFAATTPELLTGSLDYFPPSSALFPVYKLFPSQTINNNDDIFVVFNKSSGRYEAFVLGEPGSGDSIVGFELAEDKARSDESVKAYVLDEDGEKIQTSEDPDPVEYLEIRVTDTTNQWFGLSSYTSAVDGSDQRGYIGIAVLTDSYEDDIQLAIIINMDGPVDSVMVKLIEDIEPGMDTYRTELLTLEDQPDYGIYGSNLDARHPKNTSLSQNPPFEVSVDNAMKFASGAKKDSTWEAKWNPDAASYSLIRPAGVGKHIIKGTTESTVLRNTDHFNINNLEVVRGSLPEGIDPATDSIEVQNSPQIDATNGTLIYAAFDETAKENEAGWTTGCAENNEWILKGYYNYLASEKQVLGHDDAASTNSQIEWLDTIILQFTLEDIP